IDHPPARVHIYDPATGQELSSLPVRLTSMTSLAFAPEGLLAATPREDRTIRVWNVETGKEHLVLQGQRVRTFLVQLSGEGRFLAAAGTNGTLKLWDTVKGQELADISAHGGPIE